MCRIAIVFAFSIFCATHISSLSPCHFDELLFFLLRWPGDSRSRANDEEHQTRFRLSKFPFSLLSFLWHCSGDRQRLGAAVAAYLEYLNICAINFNHRNGLATEDTRAQNAIARNWLDLDIFSMKKFLEDVIGPLRIPSQRRYLQYFSGLLSGKIRINSQPLYLRFITIESPPTWLYNGPIALQPPELKCFVKIYEGLNCVLTSGKFNGRPTKIM